ncbi:MAG: polysaccharide biosynthesis tyrosine autokinase [Fimbriimonadia bacterium]
MQSGILQFLAPVRRRWWLVAIIVIPICLITAAISIFSPTMYDGFVTITEKRVDPRTNVEIYPTMGIQTVDVETRLNNLINTITSWTVLQKTFLDLVQTGEWKPKANPSAGTKQFNDAITEFTSSVDIEPVRGSELIRIHFKADSQEAAMAGISRLYTNFRDHYIELNSAAGLREREFIEAMLAKARQDFADVVERRKKYIAENEAVALQASTSSLVNLRGETLSQMNQAERDLAMSQRSQAVYQAVKAENQKQPLIPTATAQAMNPVYDQIKRQLASVEAELSSRLQTYGPNHPRMRELAQQKQALMEKEAELLRAKEAYLLSGKSETRSSELTEAERNVNLTEANIVAARARKAVLNVQLEDIEQKLQQVPEKERGLALIEAEYVSRQRDLDLLQTRLTEAKIKEEDAKNVRLTMVDDAFVRVIPKKTLIKLAIAFGLSFALSVGLVLVLGQFDAGAYSPMQAENALGYPVIGSLPRTRQAQLPKTTETASPLASSFQVLSTNIVEMRNRLQGPAIVVASAEPNVGRSSVAANLAVSLARDGSRVVLVDGDMREPSLHRHFDVENRSGLAEILAGTAAIEDVCMPTPVDGLLLITAGKPPANPVRLLRDVGLERFIEQVSKAADFVIFDSPAGSAFADADVLAGTLQNVLLIHEAGSPATISEAEFHKRLERLGINIIGVALNKVRPEDCSGYITFRRAYEASLMAREVPSIPTERPALDKPKREKAEAPRRPDVEADDEDDEV